MCFGGKAAEKTCEQQTTVMRFEGKVARKSRSSWLSSKVHAIKKLMAWLRKGRRDIPDEQCDNDANEALESRLAASCSPLPYTGLPPYCGPPPYSPPAATYAPAPFCEPCCCCWRAAWPADADIGAWGAVVTTAQLPEQQSPCYGC
ncbi:uncharacterized protein LOC124170981 [Ischnura elegans]|uniref:uncharacterized protein LOC124170981 n=1 Tax=Ischnura elegans TaxID=197161 RepID=UPI001ED8B6D1|nr:uncharacterized protein LOC124170981 [Ischnura elegans]